MSVMATEAGVSLLDQPHHDGSDVYVLAGVEEAGTALFMLGPGEVARPVLHPRVQEVWFVVSGTGRLWRSAGDSVDLVPGTSVAIRRRA